MLETASVSTACSSSLPNHCSEDEVSSAELKLWCSVFWASLALPLEHVHQLRVCTAWSGHRVLYFPSLKTFNPTYQLCTACPLRNLPHNHLQSWSLLLAGRMAPGILCLSKFKSPMSTIHLWTRWPLKTSTPMSLLAGCHPLQILEVVLLMGINMSCVHFLNCHVTSTGPGTYGIPLIVHFPLPFLWSYCHCSQGDQTQI